MDMVNFYTVALDKGISAITRNETEHDGRNWRLPRRFSGGSLYPWPGPEPSRRELRRRFRASRREPVSSAGQSDGGPRLLLRLRRTLPGES